MKITAAVLLFLVGVGVGYSATFLPKEYTEPYLPKALQSDMSTVEGTVVRKQREADRLLLTISTPEGALLATFHKHITEIHLLVDERDSVTLALGAYEPFVKDPTIKAVMKPEFQTSSQPKSTIIVPSLEGESSSPSDTSPTQP